MNTKIQYEVSELYNIYVKTRNIIQEDFNSQDNFDHVNPFWKNILSKRENFPSFSDTLSFLSNNSAFGLGKRSEGDLELERSSYVDATLAIENLQDGNVLNKFSESIIGSPKFFVENGSVGSTSFTENMMSTVRLIELVDKHLENHEKINILEIGAGWGAVMHQLMQYYGDRINKVAICDLHENLFISSVYLQSIFPDREVSFIPRQESKTANDNSLTFCPPNNIQNMNIKYDLVYNMISFQEMSVDVIHNYMAYIKEHLAEGGVFYSENGITVTEKSGRAAKASDYLYTSNFKILSIRNGARFCPHLFFGNKHEILLTNKIDGEKELDSKQLDAICYLMELRLDDNIKELKANFIEGKNSDDELLLLDLVHEFFSTKDKRLKQAVLTKMHDLKQPVVHDYMLALYLISQKRFKQALQYLVSVEKELTGLVKINVLCYIGILNRKEQPEILNKIKLLSPEMHTTAAGIFKAGYKSKMNMVGKVTRSLNLNVKTLFGFATYQTYLIWNIIWNRILSKIEKKIISMKKKRVLPYHLK